MASLRSADEAAVLAATSAAGTLTSSDIGYGTEAESSSVKGSLIDAVEAVGVDVGAAAARIDGRSPSASPPAEKAPPNSFGKMLWSRVRERVVGGSFQLHSFDSDRFDRDNDDDDVRGDESARGLSEASVVRERDGGTVLDASRLNRIHDRRRNRWQRRWRDADVPYELTLPECAAALALYLAVGVVAFSCVFESWSVVDSLNFTVITFTTVGYGDVVPATGSGRLFAAGFAAAGLASLGVALGALGSRVVEAEIRAVERANREGSRRLVAVMGRVRRRGAGETTEKESSRLPVVGGGEEAVTGKRPGSARSVMSSVSGGGVAVPSKWKCCGSNYLWWSMLVKVLIRYSPAFVSLFLGAVIIAKIEGWNIADAVYFCVATGGTIGYGDFVPTRSLSKWFAVAFIPLAVAVTGHLLGTVANFIIEQRRVSYQRRLWSHPLTLEDLEAMDWDKDGVVSELEYVEFMLLTLKKVDKELLRQIHAQFHQLDVTCSGNLTKRDLQIMAKRRLKSVRKKLELSSYKYHLLHTN